MRGRSGSSLKGVAPSNVYPTKDGELIIAANQDTLFVRLCSAMRQPELAVDTRFATHLARGENQELLDEIVGAWTKTLSTSELSALMEENGIACGGIYKAEEMLKDPHYAAREAIVNIAHKTLGSFPMQNVFPKLTRTPGEVRWIGPDLGEHNNEILGGLLGMSNQEIKRAQSVKQG